MPDFEVVSDFQPSGDQPKAIAQLAEGVLRGDRFQTLLGITGSGKSAGALRISFGIASNFRDAWRFLEFARGLMKFRPGDVGLTHLQAWRDRINERPSAKAGM